MKIIKAVYNFIVGDMVILVGVLLTVVVLALINNVSALAPLKDFSGPFLVSSHYFGERKTDQVGKSVLL